MKLLFYFIIGFSLTLFLFSCSGSKRSKKDIKSALIEMRTTSCYGKCPVYKISINGDGRVFYEGKRHVEKEGFYQKMLTDKEVKSLIEAFDKAKFFEFQDEYTSAVTDMPTTFVSYSIGKDSKKIRDYFGAPNELKDLEKLVAEIANSKEGWTKAEKPEAEEDN